MKPKFFKNAASFRQWLANNHLRETELLVGFHKKEMGEPSVTWPESVDQALCFGWIDGVRKRIDEASYSIRFTPRKSSSIWSQVNIAKVQQLIESGMMQPAGLLAFERRQENKSGIYSYEQRSVELPEPYQSLFRQEKAAWKFFVTQPASYRKAANWWVISAKRESTRQSRLAKLIDHSKHGQRIPQFLAIKKSNSPVEKSKD